MTFQMIVFQISTSALQIRVSPVETALITWDISPVNVQSKEPVIGANMVSHNVKVNSLTVN